MFINKAQNLGFLSKFKIANVEIPKFIFFSVGEWKINKDFLINKITQSLGKRICIRSSFYREDSSKSSLAGKFESFIDIKNDKININASVINLVFTPAALYASTPIMNMDLNLKDAEDFKFSPDKSVTLLLPSFIRDFLAGEQSSPEKYGLLVSEAYNTTSFLTPLIQDFGRFGALFITFLFLSISGYIYSKAREGSLFYTLLWPPIFMSLLFSAFTLYFLALIVVLYPILVMFSYNFLLNKK